MTEIHDQRQSTPAFRAVNTMNVSSVVAVPPASTSSTTVAASSQPSASHDITMSQFTFPRLPEGSSQMSIRSESATSQVSEGSGAMEDEGEVEANDKADSTPPEDSETGKEKPTRGTKSSNSGKVKKKKGTKFHCRGFGNCNLSFTRSEHLARHIRKHTGERPFMCHCGRWFSRLDNLRQHSSTVHADEEIPDSSLAASGARYQRHIRTEKAPDGTRSRTHSLSEVVPPETAPSIQPVPMPMMMGSADTSIERQRPAPLVLPHNIVPSDPNFIGYRQHTPPDSPSSTISTASFYRSGGATYNHRRAPYPQISHGASPISTPGHSRHNSHLDSPFSTPGHSARNSINLSSYPAPGTAMHARRLSMPVPPSPSLLNPETRTLPPPTASPAGTPTTPGPRRDSIGAIADDRRRTWHISSPPAYQTSLPHEVIAPATSGMERTSLYGQEPGPQAPNTPRYPATDRLPSINHILQDSLPGSPLTPRSNRVSWAGGPIEPTPSFNHDRRPSFDIGRPLLDGMPTRRVAPGQVRSGHARSVSNIETKRWGVVMHHQNNGHPYPTPTTWAERERGRNDTTPPRYLANLREQREPRQYREHRQSFGSSGESCVSEGISTPVVSTMESTKPMILGEPGEAVFHSESPERDYTHENNCVPVSGPESSGRPVVVHQQHSAPPPPHQFQPILPLHGPPPPIPERGHPAMYNRTEVSKLDALVSVATNTAKYL